MDPILDRSQQSSDRPGRSKIAYISLLVIFFAVMIATSRDKRVIFVATAVYLTTLAVIAHVQKKSVIARVALLVGAAGAVAAAWFYGFSGK